LVGTALFGSLRELQKGIEYVNQLDNALNEIRIVTGNSQEQVNKLAKSYNELSKAMNVTTTEVVKTSAELYRQGLSGKELDDRLQSIIKYAKISGISLEESNKIITATANATGESVHKIIDVFSLLGDTTASDASEIGEALQKLASTAENSGVSLEKASSWISTISSITRESAAVIGTSLKSVVSRYESIKSKGFNDEDATKLNDVVKALTSVGIAGVDAAGQLRPFAEVMDELGAKFGTLTKNEKSYITTTLFGTFQRNRGITLLNNYNTALESYQIALNAAGTADQKFAIYQQSTQAALDKATASWEGMWQASVNAEATKWLIGGLSSILDFMAQLGGVIPIVAGIISGALVASLVALRGGIEKVNIELIKANVLSGGLPVLIGLIVTALTALGFHIYNTINAENQLVQANQEIIDSYNNAKKSIEDQKNASLGELEVAKGLVEILAELESQTNKTESAKASMVAVVDELNQIMPDLKLTIDEESGALNKNTKEIYKSIDALTKYYITKAQGDDASAAGKELKDLEKSTKDYTAKLLTAKQELKDLLAIDARARAGESLSAEDSAKWSDYQRLGELNKQIEAYTKVIDYNKIKTEEAKKVIEDYFNAIKEGTDEVPKTEEPPPYVPPIDSKELTKQLKTHISAMKELEQLYKIVTDSKKDDADATQYLIDNYDSLLAAGVDVDNMLKDIPGREAAITAAYQDQAVKRGLAYEQMVGFTKSYMNIEGSAWQQYSTQLDSLQTMLINGLGSKWAEFYNNDVRAAANALKANCKLLEVHY
jgi:TP901 family phage tail tape measure protein